MDITNNKSVLVNNPFTYTQDEICNALGCSQLANTKVFLKIGAKSIKIFVCERCKSKFD